MGADRRADPGRSAINKGHAHPPIGHSLDRQSQLGCKSDHTCLKRKLLVAKMAGHWTHLKVGRQTGSMDPCAASLAHLTDPSSDRCLYGLTQPPTGYRYRPSQDQRN